MQENISWVFPKQNWAIDKENNCVNNFKNFISQNGKYIVRKYSSTIIRIKNWLRNNSWHPNRNLCFFKKILIIILSKNYIFILTDAYLYINEYSHVCIWITETSFKNQLFRLTQHWYFLFNLGKKAGWTDVWSTLL